MFQPTTNVFRATIIAAALSVGIPAAAQQDPSGLALPGTARVADRFSPLPPAEVRFRGGMLGDRVGASERNRLLHVDENDLLDCFERRSVPHQDWQGEHVGKFLHAATLAWSYTHDPALRAKLDRVVRRLLVTQEADGYLGTYPPRTRWTSWDVWVHKYDLLGLLTYYQFTHTARRGTAPNHLSAAALKACRCAGDLLIRTFGTGPGQRDINLSGEQVGMAPDSVLEPMALLYRATRDSRYLDFARYIVANYDAAGGPAILTSLETYGSVRRVANGKAYEMISNLNGLIELYRATGDPRLLRCALIAWNDIAHRRLYITGSASSYELFQDEFHLPNGEGSHICETCVSVSWLQMNLHLLRLTGDPRYADQAERTLYNHLMAAQKPTGDDWSYYTPLTGHKPYSAATTCCHSSGPRGLALLPAFCYMKTSDGGLAVNFYNAGESTTRLPSGAVTLRQTTDYPFDGRVTIRVLPQRDGRRFPLRLRIPAWATAASVAVNGGSTVLPMPGSYARLDRPWRRGDAITLNITVTSRLVMGTHENAGRAAIVRGPLVMAFDAALNPGARPFSRVTLPSDDGSTFALVPSPRRARAGEHVYQASFENHGRTTAAPRPLYLTPYATAGQDGASRFEVWIPRAGTVPVASTSLFSGAKMSASRLGNATGDIADDDLETYSVTFDGQRAQEDWYAVSDAEPHRIGSVLFAHGHSFHDGGWFDTEGGRGKPRIEVRTKAGGPWTPIAILASYPDTTTTDSKGLQDGQCFRATFAPVMAYAIRIICKPASGDNPLQAFSSAAELQAFPPP